MTIISSGTAATINSSAVNETIIIVPDVTVDALVVTHAGVSAINHGRISFGVAFFAGGGGELINHEDGLILDGVALGSSVNVINHGLDLQWVQPVRRTVLWGRMPAMSRTPARSTGPTPAS